jgi:exopolysaccharide biosynthesis polyprenyl glycosylphosphotransferase
MFKGGLEATDATLGGVANLTLASAPGFASASAPPGSLSRLGRLSLGEASRRSQGWSHRYRLQLLAIDFVAAGGAAALGYLSRFGTLHHKGTAVDLAFALAMPLGWVVTLALNHAYERCVIGTGTTEFERVFRSFLHLSVLTGFVAYASNQGIARRFILVALPLALALDVIGRQSARAGLRRSRARGRSMTPILVVGGPASVARFTTMLRTDRGAGMRVVGACLPMSGMADSQLRRELTDLEVPVLGAVDAIRDLVRESGARSVAVLSGQIDADKLRWISWQLEGTGTDLVVSPGLSQIGGRRLRIQPIAGVPLLHVSQPELAGIRHVLKAVFDRLVAGIALLILSPLLVVIAVLVRSTSNGPALFCQTRVGKNGKQFRMVKFRSMYVGAERRVGELLNRNDAADGPLFKIRDDPRVTRVGRALRRRSLDELPQLLNVLTGSMSLVGPRPPLPAEVTHYGNDTRRRLLVKPGLTGLWQVSGRSDLSWEESVRLDLHYVENWSLVLDIVVLWKTARAVMRADGAY